MKIALVTLFLFCTVGANVLNAQDSTNVRTQDNRTRLELMVVPIGYLYSSLSLGVSKLTSEKIEQSFTASGFFGFPSDETSILYSGTVRYNCNIIIGNRKWLTTYVPLWLGVRYFYQPRVYDANVDHLFYSAGSGYGMKFNFRNHHSIRAELGLGVALSTSRFSGLSAGYKDVYSMDKNYPLIPSFRLSIKYLIPLGKFQN